MRGKGRIQSGSQLLNFIVYLLGFILVIEWIRPLKTVTELGHLDLFVLYAIFCFGLTYLKWPTRLSFLLKTIVLILMINQTFLPGPIFSDYWFRKLQIEWQINWTALMAGDWHRFTESFQTALFLLIIALVSYLLYFWLITMKRAFVLIVLTIVFVTVLDTFTPYQADQAIIRIALAGLILLVINHYLKRAEQKQLTTDFTRWFQRIFIPFLLTIFAIGLLSYFAPKSDPIWPDPIPFLRSTAEEYNFSNWGKTRRVGYGEDDRRLGGTLEMDNTPLFYAETSFDHYWRIESKDFYTGHGWERQKALDFQPYFVGGLQLVTPSSDQPLRTVSVQYLEEMDFNKLVYPYGLLEVNHQEIDSFAYDEETGQIEPENPDIKLQTETIEMTYLYPDISIDQLRWANGAIPHDIASLYLQLPEELPERVIQLAEEITSDEPTRYDRVLAIESYFAQGDFTYQTRRVPIPNEQEDYVDQFLFETQVGYCDNFSTSMAVMLRAIGIPSRWVKGFTSGEQIEDLSTDDEERYRYKITNRNAHSWVEVYFPEIGWIPFEPTIGFDGSEILYEELDESNDQLEQDIENQVQDREDLIEEDEQDTMIPEVDDIEQEEEGTSSTIRQLNFWPWFYGLLIALLAYLVTRWKAILKQILFWRWPCFETEADFKKAYQILLYLLQIKKLKRSSTLTLHSFAQMVDDTLEVDLMMKLTDQYAQLIYRKDYQIDNKQLLYEYYQDLVKQIL